MDSKHDSSLHQVFAALAAEEQKTLLKILSKLRESLLVQIEKCELGSYKISPE